MHFRSENLPRPGPQLDLPFWSVNVSPSKCPSRCFAWDEKQCGIRWRPKACPSFGIATLFSSSDGCRGPQWHYTLFPFDCMLMYANMRVSGFEGREGREDCTGMKFCSARPRARPAGGRGDAAAVATVNRKDLALVSGRSGEQRRWRRRRTTVAV